MCKITTRLQVLLYTSAAHVAFGELKPFVCFVAGICGAKKNSSPVPVPENKRTFILLQPAPSVCPLHVRSLSLG